MFTTTDHSPDQFISRPPGPNLESSDSESQLNQTTQFNLPAPGTDLPSISWPRTPNLTPPHPLSTASTSSSDSTSPASPFSSSSSSTAWRCHIMPKHRTCSKSFNDPASVGRHVGNVHMKKQLSPLATESEQRAWLDNWNVVNISHRTTALTWFRKQTKCNVCRRTLGRPAALKQHKPKCKGPLALAVASRVAEATDPPSNPSPSYDHPLPCLSSEPHIKPTTRRTRNGRRRAGSSSSWSGPPDFVDMDASGTTTPPPEPILLFSQHLVSALPQEIPVGHFADADYLWMTSNIPIVFPGHHDLLPNSAPYISYPPQSTSAIPLQTRQDGSALYADSFASDGCGYLAPPSASMSW